MSITRLFESLDDKVFTDELKESLEVQFNEAVELKAKEIAEERILVLEEKAQEFEATKTQMLEEKAQEFIEMKMVEIGETVEKYLNRIVEDFVTESKDKLEESIKSEKADMIVEAFDSLMVATGVELSRIVEAKEDSEDSAKLEESIKKYDSLMEENLTLKAENDKLIKLGIINEMKEGLSLLESEKFEKAASTIEYTRDSSYTEKLEILKESILGNVEVKKEEKEDEKEEKIDEAVKVSNVKYDFSHLI